MKNPSKKTLKNKAWRLFSIYIRLKYLDKNTLKCYTCGREMKFSAAQAGHAISGRTNSVLFDEEIVRPQCRRCNIFMHGNYEVFVPKLIKEHSLKWWEQKLQKKNEIVKISKKEYKALIEDLNKKIRRLENEKSFYVL